MRANSDITSVPRRAFAILPIERVDVHHDALGIAPGVVVAKRDVGRRLFRAEPRGKARPRLTIDVRQVVAHAADAVFIGDRPVTRNDHRDVQAQDPIARCDPVAHRARPHDRCTVDEQDVAGVYDPVHRHIDQRIATGMRRADIDQLHRLIADPQLELPLESARWHTHRSLHRKSERAEDPRHVGAELAQVRGLREQRRQCRRRQLLHLLGARS